MPIRLSYDSDARIVFTQAEGVVTLQDIEQHLAEEAAIEGAAGYGEIFDACGASTNLTSGEVRQIVERVMSMKNSAPFGPTAIITDNDTFFGMARMLAILSELQSGPQIGVFKTINDGLMWLREQANGPMQV